MAKEVDLSSHEWCDLVFEGKNKDFGAYVIRTGSAKRHNMAVLWTVIAALLLGSGGYFLKKYQDERMVQLENKQEMVDYNGQDEEKEEEPEQERVEQPEPEVLPEEVLQSVKVTEIAIVEDSKVKEEDKILSEDEKKESEVAFGQKTNEEGTLDRNVTRTLKDEVVVEKKVEVKKEEEHKKEEIFKSVEQMPQFPGGEAALMKYLSSHLQYPAMAQENNIQGKVIVQFVVEKDGRIGEVKVARSVDKDLDKEAIRVVKTLPKFTPGRQNGQAVRVWYTLPVAFKLQGTN